MHGGHHRVPVLLSFMLPLCIPHCLPWPCHAHAGGPIALALMCPVALFHCPHHGPLVPVHAVVLSFHGPHPHCLPLVVQLPSLPGWCCPCLVGVIPMLLLLLSWSSVCSIVFLVLVHVVVVLWQDRFSTNPFFSHKKNKKEKKKLNDSGEAYSLATAIPVHLWVLACAHHLPLCASSLPSVALTLSLS